MAEYTSNYKLEKQQENEYINISGINENFNVIDEVVKKIYDNKVDKMDNKQLSTEDFTTELLTKLNDIEVGANKYAHPNSGVTAGTFRHVTVNEQGHVTGADNQTLAVTEGGTGATTAYEAKKNLEIINFCGDNGDFNNLVETGVYRIQVGWINKPPCADYGNVVVFRGYASNTIMQMYHDYTSGTVYTRSNVDFTWTEWIKIAGYSDLMSTTSSFKGLDATVRMINRADAATLNNANFPYPYVSSCDSSAAQIIGLPAQWWHIMYFRHLNNDGYGAQIAMSLDLTNRMFMRSSSAGNYFAWREITPLYGTSDLNAGSSPLSEGCMYLVYE